MSSSENDSENEEVEFGQEEEEEGVDEEEGGTESLGLLENKESSKVSQWFF